MTPHALQIARLETELEAMRQRAEAAEALLRGDRWHVAVPPLSLQETRALRYIARGTVNAHALVMALAVQYPSITPKGIDVALSRIRAKLPAHLAPELLTIHGAVYTIPDPDALRAFLAGEIEIRRAA